jgi:hypothetical protein
MTWVEFGPSRNPVTNNYEWGVYETETNTRRVMAHANIPAHDRLAATHPDEIRKWELRVKSHTYMQCVHLNASQTIAEMIHEGYPSGSS